MVLLTDQIKERTLDLIAHGRKRILVGRSLWKVDGVVVHVRCVTQRQGNKRFRFNLNKNSLGADYELWICGTSGHYLIPKSVIKTMHEHPFAYPDHTHQGLTVLQVNLKDHLAMYARPGIKQNLQRYFDALLPAN
ncbi:MAG: hypothetical protein ABSG08_04775 [Terriglobales bacterium]